MMKKKKKIDPSELEIQAISLDTSIFDKHQAGLEYGLLARLEQFKSGRFELIISDVVLGELKAHMVRDGANAASALKTALKMTGGTWNLPENKRNRAFAALLGDGDASSMAQARIDAFIEETGAETLPSQGRVEIEAVLERYFAALPPFSDNDSKKHEFPDAIALLALEDWARTECKRILVVTEDKDWISFCASSPWLESIGSLSAALARFQESSAAYLAERLNDMLRDGDRLGIAVTVQAALDDQASVLNFDVEADSQFYVEVEGVDAELELAEIWGVERGDAFEVVEVDEHKLVASLSLTVSASLEVFLSFSKWDSIDREYISMGTGTAKPVEEIDAQVLVTFSISRKGDIGAIESVELLADSHTTALYDLEPDWMNDSDPYD